MHAGAALIMRLIGPFHRSTPECEEAGGKPPTEKACLHYQRSMGVSSHCGCSPGSSQAPEPRPLSPLANDLARDPPRDPPRSALQTLEDGAQRDPPGSSGHAGPIKYYTRYQLIAPSLAVLGVFGLRNSHQTVPGNPTRSTKLLDFFSPAIRDHCEHGDFCPCQAGERPVSSTARAGLCQAARSTAGLSDDAGVWVCVVLASLWTSSGGYCLTRQDRRENIRTQYWVDLV